MTNYSDSTERELVFPGNGLETADRPTNGGNYSPPKIVREIERRRASLGLRPRTLSIRAGLGPTYIRDLVEGRVREPGLTALKQIASVLGTTSAELVRASKLLPDTPDERRTLRAARFAAVVWALFGDNRARAASKLKMPLARLQALATGVDPITDEFLSWFEKATGCPTEWIVEGSVERMPPKMAVRVALADPSLLPDWDDEDDLGG